MSRSKSIRHWQVACTYVGAVIGAGFASGQEILYFFANYGLMGLVGAALAGLLFALLGFIIVKTATAMEITNYQEYLVILFGNKIGRLADAVMTFFLLAGLAVMLIAAGSLQSEALGVPVKAGFLLASFIVYVILVLGLKGILWTNTILVPGLIMVTFYVSLQAILAGSGTLITQNHIDKYMPDIWGGAALLYVAYNIILGMVVLCSLGAGAKEEGPLGGILGGLVLGALAAGMCLALVLQDPQTLQSDIPMYVIAGRIGKLPGLLYTGVLWSAIMTTAVSNGFGLIQRLEPLLPWPRPILALLPLLPASLLMGWTLSRAVRVIYPLMGWFGVVIFAVIVLRAVSERIRKIMGGESSDECCNWHSRTHRPR